MRFIRLCLSKLLGLALLHAGGEACATDAPQTFSPQELRQDFAELEAAIGRIHPDVEHSVRKAELARALSGVKARLDRSMTRDEAWVTMAALNPVMADGHLVVTFPRGASAELSRHVGGGGRLFPFDVHVAADGELFIRSALNGEASALQGRRIDAIDGVPGGRYPNACLRTSMATPPRSRRRCCRHALRSSTGSCSATSSRIG